jgi:hypothetical protein
VILTTDATAEGELVASALRARGFSVRAAALASLEARVAAEGPAIVLVDLDERGAVDVAARLSSRRAVGGVSLLGLGDADAVAEAQARGVARRFERPVDIDALLADLALVAEPDRDLALGTTHGPPSLPAPRAPTSRPPDGDLDARSSDVPARELCETSSLLPVAGEASAIAQPLLVELSPELEGLLAAAEERVLADLAAPKGAGDGELVPAAGILRGPLSERGEWGPAELTSAGRGLARPLDGPSSPFVEDDADVVLPPELLAGLDEPLDPADDDALGTGSGPLRARERSHATASPSQAGQGGSVEIHTHTGGPIEGLDAAPAEPPPPASSSLDGPPPPRARRTSSAPPAAVTPRSAATPPFRPRTLPPERPLTVDVVVPNASQPPSPHEAAIAKVLGDGGVVTALARAIMARASGALALGAPGGGERRAVLHDGDFVTAASTLPDETLLAFLAARGDLERDAAARLEGKIPPFGRHAGAALIAHGYLGQGDLWPVLRAHAEWILGRALLEPRSTCALEAEPPGRLRAEPRVFGGATGAEVFVELVRRVLPGYAALARLGGPEARVAEGPHAALLAECALAPDEDDLVLAAIGFPLGHVVLPAEPELASLFYALGALGVVEVAAPRAAAPRGEGRAADPLDEEALRARVRARLALVEEGDYFALLGLPRGATSYEVRRAYVDLRRAFEPARVLTAATADLHDDLKLILEVLDEAYEILREAGRRERYRKAIEAGPPA